MEVEKTIRISENECNLLLEVLEDYLYKIAMDLEKMKGGPMTPERELLDSKQKIVEELQHKISILY